MLHLRKGEESMLRIVIAVALSLAVIGGIVWYYHAHIQHTSISEIMENPRAYDGKVLTIEGKVIDRMSLFGIKYFTLQDETGKIKVVTKRVLPSVGSRIRVRGSVKEAFAIGGTQMLVFVEEPSDGRE